MVLKLLVLQSRSREESKLKTSRKNVTLNTSREELNSRRSFAIGIRVLCPSSMAG
jgi:hypothetical protein